MMRRSGQTKKICRDCPWRRSSVGQADNRAAEQAHGAAGDVIIWCPRGRLPAPCAGAHGATAEERGAATVGVEFGLRKFGWCQTDMGRPILIVGGVLVFGTWAEMLAAHGVEVL